NTVGLRETIVASGGSNVINALNGGTVNISAACTPPTATITNGPTCDAEDFNLVLDAATGVGPFDLVINGVTYNDINVGGTIATVSMPTETLFNTATDVPDQLENNDFLNFGEPGPNITVGNKFRSAVAGYVKGFQFYRPNNIGTYTGILYNLAGDTLALAVFPGSAQ